MDFSSFETLKTFSFFLQREMADCRSDLFKLPISFATDNGIKASVICSNLQTSRKVFVVLTKLLSFRGLGNNNLG